MAEGLPPGQRKIPSSSTTGGTDSAEMSEDPTMEQDIPPPERQSVGTRPPPGMPYGASLHHLTVLNPSYTFHQVATISNVNAGGNPHDTDYSYRNFALQRTVIGDIPENITEVEKDSTSPENQLAGPPPKASEDSAPSPGKPAQVGHEQPNKQLGEKQDGDIGILSSKSGQETFHSSGKDAIVMSAVSSPNFPYQGGNNAFPMDMLETHFVDEKRNASDREESAKATSSPEQMQSRYPQQQTESNHRLRCQQQTNRKTMPVLPGHNANPNTPLAVEVSTQDRLHHISRDAGNKWSENDAHYEMNSMTINSSGGSRKVSLFEHVPSEIDSSADEQQKLASPPTPSDRSALQTPTASHPTSSSKQLQEASPQSGTDHHPLNSDFLHPSLDTPSQPTLAAESQSSLLQVASVQPSSVSHQSPCEQLQEASPQTLQYTRLTSQPRVSGDRYHPFSHLHPQEQLKLIVSPAENAVIPQKPSQPDTEQNNSTHDTTERPSEFQPSPNTVSDADYNSLEPASSHFPCPPSDTPLSDSSCQEQDCPSEPSGPVEGMPESRHSVVACLERCSSQPSCDTTLGSTAQSSTQPGKRLPSQDDRPGEGLQIVEVLGQTPPQPPLVDQQAPPSEQLQGGSLQSETDHNSLNSVSQDSSHPSSATPLPEPTLQSVSQSSNQSTARAPSLRGRKEDIQTHLQTSLQPATVGHQISPSQQVEVATPQTIQGTVLTTQVSVSGDRPACLHPLHTSPLQQPLSISSPAVDEVTPQSPQQQEILHDTAEALTEHPPSAYPDFPQPSSYRFQSGPTQDSVPCSSTRSSARVSLQHDRNGEGSQIVLESRPISVQPPSVDHQISPYQHLEEASPQGTNRTPQPSVSGLRPACQPFRPHPDPHQNQPAELARHNLLPSASQDVSHHHLVNPTEPVNRPITPAEHSVILPVPPCSFNGVQLQIRRPAQPQDVSHHHLVNSTEPVTPAEHSAILRVPPCSFNGVQLRIRRPAQPRNQPERAAALVRGEASASSVQLQERSYLGRAAQQPSEGGIRFRLRQTHQGFPSDSRNMVRDTNFVVNLRQRAVDMGETRDLPPDTEADIHLHQDSPPIQILGASHLVFRFFQGHRPTLTMLSQESEAILFRIHDNNLMHELAFWLACARDGQHVSEVCVVCRTRAVDVFVLPCCHCVLCRLCLLMGRPPICPLPACRRRIEFWSLIRN